MNNEEFITEEEILSAFFKASPSISQMYEMTYESGPYDITKASACLKAFAENLTGKKVLS